MKNAAKRAFIRMLWRRRPMVSDGVFALRPRHFAHHVSQLDGACLMVLDVVDVATGRTAGEIALRIGEGQGLFYLGHIGYHIDPPYRGRHGALRACRMCLPILREMGMRSFVITTDEDNLGSIRTCEALGCELESTVDVPVWCQAEYEISSRKRRYVYVLEEEAE